MKQITLSFTILLLFSQSLFSQSNNDSLWQIIRQKKDDQNKVDAYIQLVVQKAPSNPDSALLLSNNALAIAKKINYKKGMSDAYGWIAYIHGNKAKMQESIEYLQLGIKILESDTNRSDLASAYNNLAGIFKDMADYEDALLYYHKSEKIRLEINDLEGLSNSYYNIGNLYSKLKQYNKALDYIDRSLKIANQIGFVPGIAYIKLSKGSIYFSMDQLDSSIANLNGSLKMLQMIGDSRGIAHCYFSLAKAYFALKNYTEAKNYANKSFELATKIGNTAVLRDASFVLKDIYVIKNDYKNAYEMMNWHYKMRDSINNQDNQKAAIRSKYKYEYEKKAAADSVKTAEEKKITALQLKQEKTQRYSLYGGLFLVIVFAAFMFNRFQVTNKQKTIIEKQKGEVELQKKVVEEQKHLVEEKQKEIIDSINYAKRIQSSVLAKEEDIHKIFTESFLLYKPKDIVAGDFYFFETTPTHSFYAAADSTGHGVPGALVSMVCSNALMRCVKEFGLSHSGKILDTAREIIVETFKKSGQEVKDGMDISLLVKEHSSGKYYWSGANNPIWIINKNGLQDITANKQPIGITEHPQPFTQHELAVQKGDMIYLFTDGFADQFGGPKGKKYKYKQLGEQLIEMTEQSMQLQKQKLDKNFEDWRGDLEQIDDVCIIGIRV